MDVPGLLPVFYGHEGGETGEDLGFPIGAEGFEFEIALQGGEGHGLTI